VQSLGSVQLYHRRKHQI